VEKIKEIGVNRMNKYRFENGSLFEYSEKSNAYIFCFKDYTCTTKKEAIKEYENNDREEN